MCACGWTTLQHSNASSVRASSEASGQPASSSRGSSRCESSGPASRRSPAWHSPAIRLRWRTTTPGPKRCASEHDGALPPARRPPRPTGNGGYSQSLTPISRPASSKCRPARRRPRLVAWLNRKRDRGRASLCRKAPPRFARRDMAGAGFEPAKAEPTRLQRVPFDRSGTPPGARQFTCWRPRPADPWPAELRRPRAAAVPLAASGASSAFCSRSGGPARG